MKRLLFLLAFAFVAGATAFFLTRAHQVEKTKHSLVESGPELAWVKNELELTDDQFAKVSELHDSYRPKCMEMCHQIAEARKKLEESAKTSRGVTPELDEAMRNLAATHTRCQAAMLNHFYETAAVMNRDQASRYLETMIPYALETAPLESGNH